MVVLNARGVRSPDYSVGSGELAVVSEMAMEI